MHMTGNVRKLMCLKSEFGKKYTYSLGFFFYFFHTIVAFLRMYQVRLAYSWHIKGARGGKKAEINKPGVRII